MTRDTACNVCYNCQYIYIYTLRLLKKNSYRFIELIEIFIMNHDESVIQGAQAHKITS